MNSKNTNADSDLEALRAAVAGQVFAQGQEPSVGCWYPRAG